MSSGSGFDVAALEYFPSITLASFFIIISFIISFDFIAKFLEFALEDSPRYNRMVQNIYKELMQMGIISFVFVLYTAGTSSDQTNPWLLALDFTHILLFFVAIYFVVHTFYLIGVSMRTANLYARLNAENSYELTTLKSQLKWFDSICFDALYLPFSKFREKFEFKLLHILFKETFARLPDDFSFNLYLSKSFEQYSLKIMEFGIFSWAIVIVLALANFISIEISGEQDCNIDPSRCGETVTQTLLIAAVLLVSYVFVVMFVGRVYEVRLLHYVGVQSPEEYEDFLSFVAKEEKLLMQKNQYHGLDSDKFTSDELKQVVDDFVDAKENNEENLLYRHISLLWSSFWIQVMDAGYSVQVWYRIRMRRKVDPGLVEPLSRRESLLQPKITKTSSEQDDSDHDDEDMNSPISSEHSKNNLGPSAREKIQASLQARPKPHRHAIADDVVKAILHKHDIASGQQINPPTSSKKHAKEIIASTAMNVSRRITGVFSVLHQDSVTFQTGISSVHRTIASRTVTDHFGTTIRLRQGSGKKFAGTEAPSLKALSPRLRTPPANVKLVANAQMPSDCRDNDGSIEEPPSLFENYIKYREKNEIAVDNNISILPKFLQPKKPKREIKKDFNNIFFLSNPTYFFRAVEVALMCNSLFFALGTYFLLPLMSYGGSGWYLILALPAFITFPLIGRIVKVASLIKAVTELQLEVIRDVLTEAEDMRQLAAELRQKILSQIDGIHKQIYQPATTKKMQNAATALKQDIIHRLFKEIDVDGNGVVDKVEFRNLLTILQLHFSDKRFQRLFKAVDLKVKGKLHISDLEALLFPPCTGAKMSIKALGPSLKTPGLGNANLKDNATEVERNSPISTMQSHQLKDREVKEVESCSTSNFSPCPPHASKGDYSLSSRNRPTKLSVVTSVSTHLNNTDSESSNSLPASATRTTTPPGQG